MGSLAHHWEQQGIEKGREQGIMSIAKKMLIKNRPMEEVVEFTGLKEKTLEELQKQLKNKQHRL